MTRLNRELAIAKMESAINYLNEALRQLELAQSKFSACEKYLREREYGFLVSRVKTCIKLAYGSTRDAIIYLRAIKQSEEGEQ